MLGVQVVKAVQRILYAAEDDPSVIAEAKAMVEGESLNTQIAEAKDMVEGESLNTH